MTLFIEAFTRQLIKSGEELCGDNAEIIRSPRALTITIADGLGSGVKANILATLTTKIASSMLREGADIEDVMVTIAETLPVCKVRELAYSTIAILQILPSNECYLAEFDSPEAMLIRNGTLCVLPRSERIIAGRTIRECHFNLELGDTIMLVTDGVLHAGVGATLNMGWQWQNVAQYITERSRKGYGLREIVSGLINTCLHLYRGSPGDDATVVGIRAIQPQHLTILSGPPSEPSLDTAVVQTFLGGPGLKIICGGSTAQMVARETGLNLSTELSTMDGSLPPIAQMQGIDLVTEGILTLTAAISVIRTFAEAEDGIMDNRVFRRSDGASRLADMLINRCTHIRMMIGCAVNEAHMDSSLPYAGLRQQLAVDLMKYLRQLGKDVEVCYY